MKDEVIAAINKLALTLPCGDCGSMSGERCRRKDRGRQLPLGQFHKKRVDPLIEAYALGLADAAVKTKERT